MRLVRQILCSKCRIKKSAEEELSPEEYNLRLINERVHNAAHRLGKTRMDIAEIFGIDTALPLSKQPQKVPRATMSTMVKISNYLGVSMRWLLQGEEENEVDHFVNAEKVMWNGSTAATIGNVDHGSVLQDVTAQNITVQNISTAGPISKTEEEVLKILRRLPPREKAAVLEMLAEADKGTI